MDRRRFPFNGVVAASHLKGMVEARRFTPGEAGRITVAVADLLDAPGGRRERQLLCGDSLRIYDRSEGFAFIQSDKDDYVGYVADSEVGPPEETTHRVAARWTHVYPEPGFKSRERAALPFGALLRAVDESGRFLETAQGFVPRQHLARADSPETDPVAVAERFLGTPYLWGGNSAWGLDCSGLVQAAMLACAIPCPGDSDMQEAELGRPAPAGAPPKRGDCLFWKGHVALVVDGSRLLHANTHTMSVAYETISGAIARIEAQGEGPVTAHRRAG